MKKPAKRDNLLIFWAVAILLVLSIRALNKQSLMKDHLTTVTTSLRVVSGKNGSSLQYTYIVDGIKYSSTDIEKVLPECREHAIKMIDSLNRYQIPVVYAPNKPSNGQIILFESQFRKYRVPLPKEIANIISEVSECEK